MSLQNVNYVAAHVIKLIRLMQVGKTEQGSISILFNEKYQFLGTLVLGKEEEGG